MYKTIDLFAGAGGLSFGFKKTGKFEIVAAAEINKNAQNTFRKNIVEDNVEFELIDNVVGCDFKALSDKLGGIEIVIGGPPCQGFSNANRQKNHLISMNNGLVKEYFRAIKEIMPKAFVMENVNMLRSETHRFYDSEVDNSEIEELIEKGFYIPKREEKIVISQAFEGIDMLDVANSDAKVKEILLPSQLNQLLSVLNKNLNNNKRLKTYLVKNARSILTKIDSYLNDSAETSGEYVSLLHEKLQIIKQSIENNQIEVQNEALEYVVKLQKALQTIIEIYDNRLIGTFVKNSNSELIYEVKSYSVIDYIKAILGDEYIQDGGTINAEWFGVPQERRRYITIGVRKDVAEGKEIKVPIAPEKYEKLTVGDAILDLEEYPEGYKKEYSEIEYYENDEIGEYARLMRLNSRGVKNHITTNTTDTAKARFKSIKQGENFHSLSKDMKSTYSNPERTQNTIYLRLNPTEPSGTVVNVRKSMWIHPNLDRAITVREAARLQSFPDEFEFVGTKDSQYQQVGNAVPPLMAKGIAEKLIEYLE